MIPQPVLSRDDALLVVQSLAQSIRGDSARQIGKASLFPEIDAIDEFGPAQRGKLAAMAISFFDLEREPDAARRLQGLLPGLERLGAWADALFPVWRKKSLCFHSSGSTGEPQTHCFPAPLLLDELEASAPAFLGRARIVSVMPVHHIFGMMYGPLLSKHLALPLVLALPLPLASFFDRLLPGDLVVAFPFFWQALLDMISRSEGADGIRLPDNLAGLTATSPCPPEVIRGLLHPAESGKSPSLAAMTEIYGSTETNGIGMRRNGGEWYELFSIWDAVRLQDGRRGIQRRLPDGGVAEPRAMPDLVAWSGERSFKPVRRVDNAVQVGGINVYPEKVAEVIRSHPLVRDCAVRLMRPEEGTRLKAFIVPDLPLDEAGPLFGKAFRDWLAARLETAWRPKRITLGAALPVNAMNKASDWE
jgi:4-coumarate--CoA ligase (photoactive yellow protein activation family)